METEDETLDLVWGAEAIAAELNTNVRRCFYLLENKAIPARKVGRLWVAERGRLRRHFCQDTTEVEAS